MTGCWSYSQEKKGKDKALEGLPGSPGKSQREGQEDQGDVKELSGLAVLRSPGPPGLLSGSPLGSWAFKGPWPSPGLPLDLPDLP